MSNKERKCKCDNPENGDIIIHNDEGRCVVCGRQYPVWAVPSQEEVEKATHYVLEKYAKTFKDLAEFDSGAREVPNTVPSQQVELKCECNSVGAHHSDCPMSMCFFKKCDGDYKDKVITVPPDWKNKDMKRTIDNPYVVGVEDTKPELEIEEIIKNFEANFAEQYSPNDWKRLKGIRVQEPLQWLRENIYELLLKQREELESKIEGMKRFISYNPRKIKKSDTDYNKAIGDVLEVLKGKK